jgi:AraC family ethanolamine operon transcriptional activator
MHEIELSSSTLGSPPSQWVVHNHDAYDQARTFGALDQCYQQLSTGIFQGSMEVIQHRDVTIFRETLEQSVFQTGRSDPDHLTIALACELSQPAYWNGQYIGEDAAIAFAPGREFELRSPHHAC